MRLFMTFVFSLLVNIAAADVPDPPLPALYSVTGVTPDDALNIRAQPNGSAEILGTFTHDAGGIEVVALSREGTWAQVNSVERTGWVAARYLRAEPMEGNALGLPVGLQCFGTEPFWDITFGPGPEMTLRTPADARRYDVLSTSSGPFLVNLSEGAYRFAWQDEGTTITAHILNGTCFDGMSDRTYGLHYVDDQGPRTGCCSLN